MEKEFIVQGEHNNIIVTAVDKEDAEDQFRDMYPEEDILSIEEV